MCPTPLQLLPKKARDRADGTAEGVQVPAWGSKTGSRMMELLRLWIKSAPKISNPPLNDPNTNGKVLNSIKETISH